MNFRYCFITIFLLLENLTFAATYPSIYEFLRSMNFKYGVTFNTIIEPLNSIEIARKLIEIEKYKNQLNTTEKGVLEKFFGEYKFEISRIKGIKNFEQNFFFNKKNLILYEYSNNDFSIKIDPMFELTTGYYYGKRSLIRRNGFYFRGLISSNIDYYLYFNDNYEKSENLDFQKSLVNEESYKVTKRGKNFIEYDEVKASISYSWETGKITLGKEDFRIGSGNLGKLILSDRAPSFPFIRLDYYPVNWFRFMYFHGFLKSNIPDSSTLRYNSNISRISIQDIPKYYVFHIISILPFENFNVSIGESVVYSERLQVGYFIPIIFFRALDHYLDIGNSSSGNAQMFCDLSYIIRNLRTKFYSTIFIDEISFSNIFRGGRHKALGYTVGFETRDIILPISKFYFEYTLINPFVYLNSVDAQVYSNNGVKIGHWIESNSDLIAFGYESYLTKKLYFQSNLWYFRKGKMESPNEQYQAPYPKTLYGNKRIEKGFNFQLIFEPISPITVKFRYLYTDIYDSEILRTPDFKIGKRITFFVGFGYNF